MSGKWELANDRLVIGYELANDGLVPNPCNHKAHANLELLNYYWLISISGKHTHELVV